MPHGPRFVVTGDGRCGRLRWAAFGGGGVMRVCDPAPFPVRDYRATLRAALADLEEVKAELW
jgi:hypothetical protein